MARESYLVGIAGEADHQPAIARCVIGERVEIIKQLDQAPGLLALTVVSQRKDVLGHIPPNSWLSKAVYNRGDTATRSSLVSGHLAGGCHLLWS